MPEFADIYGSVPRGGTLITLDRVVGWDGSAITQADIAAAEYSIYSLDEHDPDTRTAVEGHEAVALDPVAVIYDALQTDAVWDADASGYNFRHTLDVSDNEAFAVAGREYLIEYRLTPSSGQEILLRFRIQCI